MPDDSAKKRGPATKAEIVIVFVLVSAIIVFSYLTARHAALNTPNDPVFRDLVSHGSTKPFFKAEYLYVPLLFQMIAWLGFFATLLPKHVQESWFYITERWNRPNLYFILTWCLLISIGIYWQSSNALRAAALPALAAPIAAANGHPE